MTDPFTVTEVDDAISEARPVTRTGVLPTGNAVPRETSAERVERLKRARITPAELGHLVDNALVTPSEADEIVAGGGKPSQAGDLVGLAKKRYRLGQALDGEPFAVPIDGPHVARMLRGGRASLRAELAAAYSRAKLRVPSGQALADALAVIEGQALSAPREALALRAGRTPDGAVWLDLGDSTGRAIRIAPDGWSSADRPAILFRRTELTGSLPAPDAGSLDAYLALLNVSADNRALIVAFLVATLLGAPTPILFARGPAGAAKSSAARLIVRLIDPSPAPLRAVPRDLEGWAVAASGSLVVGLDNLSRISEWFSDALCRAVTGEAIVRRALYTDQALSVVAFRRSVVLTAIDAGALRGDLADRLLTIDLPAIAEQDRRDDDELEAAFLAAWPGALGGLLTLTARVMTALPGIRLARRPRMADYGRVLAAVDAELGTAGLAHYLEQRSDLQREAAEGDRIGAALIAWMANQIEWQGTATDLLAELTPERASKEWPETPRALSGALRRVTQPLAAAGIVVSFTVDGHDNRRLILIERVREQPLAPLATGQLSANHANGASDASGLIPPISWPQDRSEGLFDPEYATDDDGEVGVVSDQHDDDLATMFDLWFDSEGLAPAGSGIGKLLLGIAERQSAPRSKMPGRGKSPATIALGQAARDVLAGSPYAMTLRQLYYALVSAGAIDKTEAGYGKLKRVMREQREAGAVPWDWLVDHTRSVFAPRTWDGIEGLLNDSAKLYRRDLMRQQPVAIQLWAESDSIGSVIAQTADRYCIPTFIGRGYSARGYLWAAAQDAVKAHDAGKGEVIILHVGDHDPSGEDIFRDVAETLNLYALAIEAGCSVAMARVLPGQSIERPWLTFERLALTPEQVDDYALPVRPPKASDVRTAKFTGKGAVEVEALPVDVLLAIVENAITSIIDPEALRVAEFAEQSERQIAQRIAATPIERLIEAAA